MNDKKQEIPIRQEILIIPADKPQKELNWKFYEIPEGSVVFSKECIEKMKKELTIHSVHR